MSEAGKTQDLRIRRTRYLLKQAMIDLMAEQSFQSITVQAITDKAMVNRATFYDHFVDKYALLEYAISELFKQTLHGKLPDEFRFSPDHLQLLVATTCEALLLLRNHCLPHDQGLLPLVQTQITTVIQGILTDWLHEAQPRGSFEGTPELAATVASWAIYGAAMHWSQARLHEPVERYAAEAMVLIMAGLNEALDLPKA